MLMSTDNMPEGL